MIQLGKIEIIIELDESKLSEADKIKFNAHDQDCFNNPDIFEQGFDKLFDGLNAKIQNTLAYKYLGKSEKAISLRLSTC